MSSFLSINSNHFSFMVMLLFCYSGQFWYPVNCALRYNVSLSQMETCQHYLIPESRGYVYLDFFHLPQLRNNKLASDELLHLKFYVMTSRDAHILLSANDQPRLFDRVYEIVIGAGRNYFSTIRTNIGRRRVATNMTPNILSMLHPTPIEIVQKKDAKLMVYINGLQEEPIMSYTDLFPLQINYISFATYDNEPASWFYDCEFDGFGNELEPEIKKVTPTQRLIDKINENSENATIPSDLKNINITLQLHALNYETSHNLLQTRFNIILYWFDERLTWNSSVFNEISSITYKKFDIWLPKLRIINGVLENRQFSLMHSRIRIEKNGNVTMYFEDTELTTFCASQSGYSWPKEQLDCEVIFGLDGQQTSQQLSLNYDYLKPLSTNFILMNSFEWIFHTIAIVSFDSKDHHRYSDDGILQTMKGDIAVEFKISRQSNFYGNVFSMPVLACQILLMLSFLLRGYQRGALILTVVLLIVFGLMFIAKRIPSSEEPKIMTAYEHMIGIGTFCYILHLTIIWLNYHPPKYQPPNWLKRILNYSPLRLILCMRLAEVNEYINSQLQPWHEVTKMLNALFFLIINFTFVLIDALLLPQF